ncbi:MAG: ATP--guanido phosphotransferase, partial [Gemmatimonadales bacterium]
MSGSTQIPDGGMPWLDASGPQGHLAISTRVRLARNISGRPFSGRNTPEQRESIVTEVAGAARAVPALADAALYRLDALSVATRHWLTERQLVSRDLAGLDASGRVRRGAALLLGHATSVMINEEDHLRLQGLRSGFALEPAYAATDRVDHELGARISFAFHAEFGYLTACPTNVGTGLRASVLIHLPGLVLTKEITKVLQGLAQVGLTYRGLFGEGSDVLGHLFQLSNQTTLGKSEIELVDHLSRMVRQVMEYEERARIALRSDAVVALEDKVWRAWAVLRHARVLSFDETVNLLSGVRLGVGMQLLPDVPLYLLNRLLVLAQTAHVAQAAGVSLDDESLPEHRAA